MAFVYRTTLFESFLQAGAQHAQSAGVGWFFLGLTIFRMGDFKDALTQLAAVTQWMGGFRQTR